MPRLDMTLASGIFKFSSNVNSQVLVDFVQENWSNDPSFVELSVRGCDGERKSGIAFKYHYKGHREDFERFIDQSIGRLKRVFNNDFVGWDVSSSTHVIK